MEKILLPPTQHRKRKTYIDRMIEVFMTKRREHFKNILLFSLVSLLFVVSPCPAFLNSSEYGKICFSSGRDESREIYVMDVDGCNQRRITFTPLEEMMPAWSPDGKKIAFEGSPVDKPEIYVMNADGSNQMNLTKNSDWDLYPAWSPDGTKIAFASERDGNWEIYVMNADGSNQMNLTNHPDSDHDPGWSPDGTKIAFESWRQGNVNNEIYVMDADGDNQMNLTNHPALDMDPTWCCTSLSPTEPSLSPTKSSSRKGYVLASAVVVSVAILMIFFLNGR